jgi:hypothetical protein
MKTKPIYTRVKEKLFKQIEQAAEKDGLTNSAWLRLAAIEKLREQAETQAK